MACIADAWAASAPSLRATGGARSVIAVGAADAEGDAAGAWSSVVHGGVGSSDCRGRRNASVAIAAITATIAHAAARRSPFQGGAAAGGGDGEARAAVARA